uniref:G-protein coupled receptors family 1 profile domain-containing protein n=1 Tax=Pelusios castaneus TaxID=367368 RepID=A0A8C8SDS9_9SAUR
MPKAGTPVLRIFASIYFLIFLLGMPGNVLLLLVLIPDLMRSGASHVFRLTGPLMVNIALLDLLFFLYNVPIMFGNVLFRGWPLGYAMCLTYNSLSLLITFADFYSLLAISLLRYVAVIHPTRTRAASQRQIAWACAFIWLLAFLISIPLWLHYTTVEVAGETYCVNQMPKKELTLYFRLLGGVAFLPPLLLMILCYSRIICALWVRRMLAIHTASSLQVNWRATVMALVTMVTFVVMWVPYWLVVFLTKDDELLTTGPMYLASNLTTLLAYANRCVNPIICFSLSSQCQAGLRKLLGRMGWCHKRSGSLPTAHCSLPVALPAQCGLHVGLGHRRISWASSLKREPLLRSQVQSPPRMGVQYCTQPMSDSVHVLGMDQPRATSTVPPPKGSLAPTLLQPPGCGEEACVRV